MRSKVMLNPTPSNQVEFNTRSWRDWFSLVFRRVGEGPFMIQGYPAASLPPPEEWGTTDVDKAFSSIIYVPDESGGATLAFSDGTNWRRVQDRVIVS